MLRRSSSDNARKADGIAKARVDSDSHGGEKWKSGGSEGTGLSDSFEEKDGEETLNHSQNGNDMEKNSRDEFAKRNNPMKLGFMNKVGGQGNF